MNIPSSFNVPLIAFAVLGTLGLSSVHAWSFQDCVDVGFDHPDCDQYTSPPSSNNTSEVTPQDRVDGGGGHSRYTKGVWISDGFIPPCNEYHYALQTPPRTYPGVPKIVEFEERVKSVCRVVPPGYVGFHDVPFFYDNSFVDPPGYCFQWSGFA